MQNRRLEQLIRQVVESQELFDPPAARPALTSRTRRALHILVPLAAAAALALLLYWPKEDRSDTSVARPDDGIVSRSERPLAASTIPVSLAYQPASGVDSSEVDRFHSCADEDAYAIVLFRVYNSECSCITWRVHVFEDGSRLARLQAGVGLEIPLLDGDDIPPVEQMILLAVARTAGVLPAGADAADSLLECLNDSLPPTPAGEPQDHSPSAVLACVPQDVVVVPQPFFVHRSN